MKRKPTFAPYIGSLGHDDTGTEDLISDLAWHLRHFLTVCRVDRETRKLHIRLLQDIADGPYDELELLDQLTDALSHYAPPYTTFGERDGEWGFWPDMAGEIASVLDVRPDIPPRHWGNDVYLVNDHGNVECGRFDKRGRFHSYWSAV